MREHLIELGKQSVMSFIAGWFRALLGGDRSELSTERARRKLAKYEATLKGELKRWCAVALGVTPRLPNPGPLPSAFSRESIPAQRVADIDATRQAARKRVLAVHARGLVSWILGTCPYATRVTHYPFAVIYRMILSPCMRCTRR